MVKYENSFVGGNMKFAVIQPAYSMEFGRVDECFEKLLAQLEECDSSLDVIVLPEYSDVPANIRGKEEYDSYVVKNNARILDAAAKAAVRCSATVFVNAASQGKNGYINTTYAIDKNGKVIAIYPYGNQNAPIPAGGIVLSGHGTMGTWIQNNLKVGSYVKVNGVNVTVYPDEISMKTPDGGSIKVGEGGKITSLPKVKKTGYVFCGWYTGGTLFNPSAPVTSDIVLLAHWEERRISVKYDLDGGSFSGTATSTAAGRNIIRPAESIVIYDGDHKSSTTGTNIYGAEVVVSAEGIVTEIRTYGLNNSPIPEGGFVLSGHNTAGSWLTKNIRIGSLIVLSENSFTVYESYEQYDIICEKTVLYGSALGTLPSAIKAGASFGGWLLPDGTKADANTLISYDSSEIVLKAKWN